MPYLYNHIKSKDLCNCCLFVLQLQNDLPGPYVGIIDFFSSFFKVVTVQCKLKGVATSCKMTSFQLGLFLHCKIKFSPGSKSVLNIKKNTVNNTKSPGNILQNYQLILLAKFRLFLYLLSRNIGEIQFTAMNATESSVKLPLIFGLNGV